MIFPGKTFDKCAYLILVSQDDLKFGLVFVLFEVEAIDLTP